MPTTRPAEQIDKAAALLATGHSISQTAAACGVAERTVLRWKREPKFLSAYQRAQDEQRHRIIGEGAAVKQFRIAALRRRRVQLLRIAAARAGNPARGGVEWDTSGFLIQKEVCVGGGQFGKFILEYRLDTALLCELRAIERQIAEEMGEARTPPATPPREEVLSETAVTLLEMYPSPEELAEAKARFLQVRQRRITPTESE
jgi:hypothetical protein